MAGGNFPLRSLRANDTGDKVVFLRNQQPSNQYALCASSGNGAYHTLDTGAALKYENSLQFSRSGDWIVYGTQASGQPSGIYSIRFIGQDRHALFHHDWLGMLTARRIAGITEDGSLLLFEMAHRGGLLGNNINLHGLHLTLFYHGIYLGTNVHHPLIGGADTQLANVIMHNGRIHDLEETNAVSAFGHGVYLENSSNNRILSNVIASNATHGVALYPDRDTGQNQENLILSILQFFSNPQSDESGFGEGETWVDSTNVTTSANGLVGRIGLARAEIRGNKRGPGLVAKMGARVYLAKILDNAGPGIQVFRGEVEWLNHADDAIFQNQVVNNAGPGILLGVHPLDPQT